MEEYLQEAIDIVKAQAGVREMGAEEIVSMVESLSKGIASISEGGSFGGNNDAPVPPVDPKTAIKERSIICLESGKSFKVLTKKHLAKYGLTPEEYKAKWGYPKNTSLVCKSLARERRKKMQEMKLWERRKKNTSA